MRLPVRSAHGLQSENTMRWSRFDKNRLPRRAFGCRKGNVQKDLSVTESQVPEDNPKKIEEKPGD